MLKKDETPSVKKSKKVKKEIVNGLLSDENLDKLVEEFKSSDASVKKNAESGVSNSNSNKREELLKAAEEGYISQKVEYIRKCSAKVIEKIYKSYEIKRKRDADIFFNRFFY